MQSVGNSQMAWFPTITFVLVAVLAGVGRAREDHSPIDFNQVVRPIFSAKCFACHGPDEQARQAELRLDVRDSALSVIVPGQAGESELMVRVSSQDDEMVMPPKRTHKMVTAAEREALRRWIDEGAEYDKHWSFIPPQRWQAPEVTRPDWPRNEIDHFVLSRLDTQGLSPSPEAERRTLIRRVTLDLSGLPPAPHEVEAFVRDEDPRAYEKLVDRLLESPRYGEHMAGYWLEAARYADTDGYQNDRYRYQHVWRDWVIMALNDNLPYDQFVIEQLAGDMLPGATLKQQIATGFCRNHRINSEDGSIPAEWHVENVVDRVDTLGTVFLGLTLGCARCHDHKYDPITQKEYYGLFAYFNNVPEWGVGPNNGNSPPFVNVPKSWPNLTSTENRAVVPEPVKLRRARVAEGNGLRRPQAGSPQTVMVMHEMPQPRDTYLLQRGQYNMPVKSEKLSPGVPAALTSGIGLPPTNRLELAGWLVRADNPLTARVAVNRCWQQFFGVGLVETSENFGSQGRPPSHPQLLDWLAVDFMQGGWDVKAIQKKIVMSATYRQASSVSEQLLSRDPDNRLLARGPRFRLPAFALRDQALAVSGLLVNKIGGPSVKPYMPPKIWRSISNNTYKQDKGQSLYRRSVYTYWRRTIPPPTMVGFNAAEREVCVVRKDRTNTPLQALTLMNNIAFVEASRFMAERMLRESEVPAKQLAFGFRLAVGRPPTSEELSLLFAAHSSFTERYANDSKAAQQLLRIGEKPRDQTLDGSAHAAMTMTASLILNLDETVTKE